jgi:hypothetical protein
MGEACGKYGRRDVHARVLVGRPDVNERIILKRIFKKWDKGGKD